MQQGLSIQKHCVGSRARETLFEKRHHPLLHILCPLFSRSGLGHQKLQGLASGSGHAKNPLLLCCVVILSAEPSFRSLKGSLLLLFGRHVCETSAKPRKLGLQFLGIPSELAEVCDRVKGGLPLFSGFAFVDLAEPHPPFLQLLRGIVLAALLPVKKTFGVDPPYHSFPANLLLQLLGQGSVDHSGINVMSRRPESFELFKDLGIFCLSCRSLPTLASTLALLILNGRSKAARKTNNWLDIQASQFLYNT